LGKRHENKRQAAMEKQAAGFHGLIHLSCLMNKCSVMYNYAYITMIRQWVSAASEL
jgi:hypothetical protein